MKHQAKACPQRVRNTPQEGVRAHAAGATATPRRERGFRNFAARRVA